MFQPLDGPSKQYTLSVGVGAVVEIKPVAGSPLAERKLVTLQSEDGKFRVYFGDGTTPSVGDVSTDGFLQFKTAKDDYEASDTQALWVISESGTINIIVAERA